MGFVLSVNRFLAKEGLSIGRVIKKLISGYKIRIMEIEFEFVIGRFVCPFF